MEVQDVTRTAADLLLLLLMGFLALQLLDKPHVRTFAPPAPPPPPESISPNLPSEGYFVAQNGSAGAELEKGLNLSAPYAVMENDLFELVNDERVANGLARLRWNDEVASVAREHSFNLAKQNELLTERDLLCYVPLVHHEGFDFGLYHNDRLQNKSIYYFASSGENIFLASAWKARKTFDVDEANCSSNFTQPAGPEAVKQELDLRLKYAAGLERVNWLFTFATKDEIENSIVQGWMASEGHRRNILNANYTESGIGVSKVNDFFIVTQIFIEAVDCGYRFGPCCEEEGYYPYCYVPMECFGDICVERNT
jgi:uncharacterized protein YkwD